MRLTTAPVILVAFCPRLFGAETLLKRGDGCVLAQHVPMWVRHVNAAR